MAHKKAPHRNRSKPTDPAFEKTRAKIQSTQIVNALMDHILEKNGREDMKATQVNAGLGLLKKVLPDLQSTELNATVDATLTLEGKTEAELNARIAELTSK